MGGDLPVIVGGGGISLDRDTADECFNRCEENPRCQWYTYDERWFSDPVILMSDIVKITLSERTSAT